ncbi:tetratricopeptide repeat protein [Rosistilla carotiformis]|nr:tetratricopeptide repeat protein [Rosistilla carotiformis]
MILLQHSAKLMNGNEVLATVPANTYLYVLEQKDGWFLAKPPNSDRPGWLKSSDLQYHAIGQSPAEQERLKKAYRDFAVYRELNAKAEWAAAIEPLRRCLVVEQDVLGEEHPDVAESRLMLGYLHKQLDQLVQATEEFEAALAIYQRYLGNKHAKTAECLFGIGDTLRLSEKFDESRRSFEQALSVFESLADTDTIEKGNIVHRLGLVEFFVGDYETARKHFLRALAIFRIVLGTEHERTAATMMDLGNTLFQLSEFKAAVDIFQEMLSVSRKVHGDESAEVATAFASLGKSTYSDNQFKQSLDYYQQALNRWLVIVGEDDAETASALTGCGHAALGMYDYEAAEAYYQRVLEIERRIYGESHLEVGATILNLGVLESAREAYEAAIPLYMDALKIFDQQNLSVSDNTARAWRELGICRYELDDFEKAAEDFNRALPMYEQIYGSEHREVAICLNWLGSVASLGRQDLEGAKAYHTRAQAIFEKVSGWRSTDVAVTLRQLGDLARQSDDYATAQRLLQQALDIVQETCGDVHVETAHLLDSLGVLSHGSGDFVAARRHFDQQLQIHLKLFGEKSSLTAGALINQGDLAHTLGDYSTAKECFERALKINTELFGDDGTYVAEPLSFLAMVHKDLKEYEKSLQYNELALEKSRKALGDSHWHIAKRYNMKGAILEGMGDLDAAEVAYRKAIEIFQLALGPQSLETVDAIENLAVVNRDAGDFENARQALEQALSIRRRTLGHEHSSVVWVLMALAELEAQANQTVKAGQYFEQARRLSRKRLATVLPTMTANEQIHFLRRSETDGFAKCLSFAVENPESERIKIQSVGWLINGKAIGQEALAESALLSRPETIEYVRRLRVVRARLSQLGSLSVGQMDEQERREAIAAFETEQQDLQRQIAAAGTGMSDVDPWVSAGQLRDSLPAGSIMIQLAQIFPYEFRQHASTTNKLNQDAPRYFAWLIPASGEGDVKIVDLGDAAKIDALVEQTTTKLKGMPADPSPEMERQSVGELQPLMKGLADRLIAPLLPFAEQAKEWILSPDGALWLAPWAALPIERDFVIDRHDLRFVVSGRELVASRRQHAGITEPVIVADPDYDLEMQNLDLRNIADHPTKDSDASADHDLFALRGIEEIDHVNRLKGTATEAKLISPEIEQLAARPPKVLLQANATETAVKSLYRPRFLVLSTHGYFFEDQVVRLDADHPTTDRPNAPATRTADGRLLGNPLVRCGLMLAGCNNRRNVLDSVSDDGVLTGLEVVGIDLRGTELVVLSACNTGLGSIQCGEGVAGLRQAFQFAGAEAVAATLWTIPDDATVSLMQTFFANLASGKRKAQALCDAQRSIIDQRRRIAGVAHPYFWAAFTLTGR